MQTINLHQATNYCSPFSEENITTEPSITPLPRACNVLGSGRHVNTSRQVACIAQLHEHYRWLLSRNALQIVRVRNLAPPLELPACILPAARLTVALFLQFKRDLVSNP